MDVVTIDRSTGLADWTRALAERKKAVRELVAAFDSQVEEVAGRLKLRLLKTAVSGLNKVLGEVYRGEAQAIADLAGVSVADVLLANLAYDVSQVGCTSVVVRGGAGPLHFRNLDWTFPGGLLRKHATVARVLHAEAGDYCAVGWPGQFGMLTGVAKGRFSVTVNFVRHRADSTLPAIARHAVQGHLPVTWLVRDVFEEAADFDEAVRMLSRTRIVAPVLFTVAGVRQAEAAVVERTASTASVRRLGDAPALCATNHYLGKALEGSTVDVTGGDTYDRYQAALERAPEIDDVRGAMALLSRDSLLRDHTQYQCAMEPRTGRMWARVPGEPLQEIAP